MNIYWNCNSKRNKKYCLTTGLRVIKFLSEPLVAKTKKVYSSVGINKSLKVYKMSKTNEKLRDV